MTAWLIRTVDRLDRIGVGKLLIANALVSLFVLVAHGGALLLVRSGKPNEFGAAFSIVYVTIPVALIALVIALVAWPVPHVRDLALRIHTFMLGCLAAFALWYAVDVIATGIPQTVNFVWNPILFAFLVAYPVYLARRSFVRPAALARPAFRYAHVFAVLISVALSALVLWRIYAAAP